jgi:hypothetical protein
VTREGWIHVAGIKDLAEANMLVECGVSVLGFPLVVDVHREDLTVHEAAAIAAAMRGRATETFVPRSRPCVPQGSTNTPASRGLTGARAGTWLSSSSRRFGQGSRAHEAPACPAAHHDNRTRICCQKLT